MVLLKKYFSDLSTTQINHFEALAGLYHEWNARINVISRKDMDNFEERHLIHSLAIAKIIKFSPGTKILDVGTGGGLPGIPLSIMFPSCDFVLIDSIGKKIKVVNEIKTALGLKNIEAKKARAEEMKECFDFVISRAVTTLPEFISWTGDLITPQNKNSLKNGVLYLKGGDFENEFAGIRGWSHSVFTLKTYFEEEFFETKKLVHLFK